MAGRISDGDKERVRELNPIESVVGEYVSLRPAGGGNLKGLCPFHDEKSPSFNVRPSHGAYHCFGCGQGGDVFRFIAELEHLSFVESVERLADRVGFQLTRVEGGSSVREDRGTRSRLIAANKAAAAFYAERLEAADAEPARAFLAERGFDVETALRFGCGFAPGGWDDLTKALLAQGFSSEELYTVGLAKQGQRGPIDRFNRRLLWAIRDAAGDVVGFGARRLFDDDRIEAKYLNTSDTPLYHKSQVLYGLDLAKRHIGKQRRAVVVEGYTDVMAMHVAGVETAVASCGTAFGDEHISVLRRYLWDTEVIRGEVVYTFDGDSAGQKAALKAFDSDQRFAANTFIAVAPDNLDPCELRQHKGDAALKELVESRKPLFAFAIGATLADYDLKTAEGRVSAARAAVPLVARIKELDLRDQYINELAPQLAMDTAELRQRVRAAAARPVKPTGLPAAPAAEPPRRPAPENRATSIEREAVKLALQHPDLVGDDYERLDSAVFTDSRYAGVHAAILAAGWTGTSTPGAAWTEQVREQLPADSQTILSELAVEPFHNLGEVTADYAGLILAGLLERSAAARIRELHIELRQAESDGDVDRRDKLQNSIAQWERYRRQLRDRAISGS